MDIKGLFVWTHGSVIRVIQLIVPFNHLDHGSLDPGEQQDSCNYSDHLDHLSRFLFVSSLDQFCLYFPKSNVYGIPSKHKCQKLETYISKPTYQWLVWMTALISHSMA